MFRGIVHRRAITPEYTNMWALYNQRDWGTWDDADDWVDGYIAQSPRSDENGAWVEYKATVKEV